MGKTRDKRCTHTPMTMAAKTSSPREQPQRSSVGNSKLLLIIIALSTLLIASLNYLQFQTHLVTPKPHLREQDASNTSREYKALKRKLNEALNESRRKEKEIASLKTQLDTLTNQAVEKHNALVGDIQQLKIQSGEQRSVTNVDEPAIDPSSVLLGNTSTPFGHIQKSHSINSFWWPSLHSGLLGKLYKAQNPTDCNASHTKYFVWRSRHNHEEDTRGLTAWGHAAKSHLMHG